MRQYVLDELGRPVPCPDLLEWALWFGSPDRSRVRQESFKGMWLSTVFLGVDHAMPGRPPLLFETMVFYGDYGGEMRRYSTRMEALTGHEAVRAQMLFDLANRPKGFSQSHWRKVWRSRWVPAS